MSNNSNNPHDEYRFVARRGWIKKFGDAAIGVWQGIQGQSSFFVHIPVALLVIALAAMLGISLERWCLLVLCIAMVIAAELQNSGLEWICRSITSREDNNIRKALNISSGAVLVLSIAAAIIGVLIFASAIAEKWFVNA